MLILLYVEEYSFDVMILKWLSRIPNMRYDNVHHFPSDLRWFLYYTVWFYTYFVFGGIFTLFYWFVHSHANTILF